MQQRTLNLLKNGAWSRAREGQKRAFSIFNWRGINLVPRVLSYWQWLFCAIRQEDRQKEQISVCRLCKIAFHSHRTSQDNAKLRSFFSQFPSSGALLNFGSHPYRLQSSQYVKARSLKQSSFSFFSLRHIENYKEGDFYLVPLTQLHSLGSFLPRSTVGSLQIKNIAGTSGKRLKENWPGRQTTVSS